jgi:hypothetical protein
METSDIIQIVISLGSLWLAWKALKKGAENEVNIQKIEAKIQSTTIATGGGGGGGSGARGGDGGSVTFQSNQ